MEKGNALALGTTSRSLVDESNADRAAASEGCLQIVDREAHVVNTRTAFGDELSNGRVGRIGFEELDERFARSKPDYVGAIRILQRHGWHAEHIAVKGDQCLEILNCNADVREPRAATGRILQGQWG